MAMDDYEKQDLTDLEASGDDTAKADAGEDTGGDEQFEPEKCDADAPGSDEEGNRIKRVLPILAALAAILVLAAAAGTSLWGPRAEKPLSESDRTEQAGAISDVAVTVEAEGWDDASSPFLIHVEGEGSDFWHATWHDADKNTPLELEPGEYEKTNVVIDELPYQVNRAQLLETISKLREEKKGVLLGISDITDESDRHGTRCVIKIKKDCNYKPILDMLFKSTQMAVSYGINMVAIADGKPQTLGLIGILDYYVRYQREYVVKRTKCELDAAKKREHILEGLVIAVNNIDAVVNVIKNSKSTAEARDNLRRKFNLSERQAEAILDLRLDGDAILLFHGLAGVNGVHDRASLTSLLHNNTSGSHCGARRAGQEKVQASTVECDMGCKIWMLVVKMMHDSHGSILLQGYNM